jgi:hypothetical protein
VELLDAAGEILAQAVEGGDVRRIVERAGPAGGVGRELAAHGLGALAGLPLGVELPDEHGADHEREAGGGDQEGAPVDERRAGQEADAAQRGQRQLHGFGDLLEFVEHGGALRVGRWWWPDCAP